VKVVTFYTSQTEYENEVAGFKKSCEQFNIQYEIFAIESRGSWTANCQAKAEIIKKALNMLQEPIVFVDIDARFMREPVLFETIRSDFAYHYLEHRNELLSGTLYFANSGAARDLLDKWIAENEKNDCWDQRNLQTVYEKHFPSIGQRLPSSYCKIYDCHEQACDPSEIVIMHYQKSRQYRRMI
jgi:hypothetical protein